MVDDDGGSGRRRIQNGTTITGFSKSRPINSSSAHDRIRHNLGFSSKRVGAFNIPGNQETARQAQESGNPRVEERTQGNGPDGIFRISEHLIVVYGSRSPEGGALRHAGRIWRRERAKRTTNQATTTGEWSCSHQPHRMGCAASRYLDIFAPDKDRRRNEHPRRQGTENSKDQRPGTE